MNAPALTAAQLAQLAGDIIHHEAQEITWVLERIMNLLHFPQGVLTYTLKAQLCAYAPSVLAKWLPSRGNRICMRRQLLTVALSAQLKENYTLQPYLLFDTATVLFRQDAHRQNWLNYITDTAIFRHAPSTAIGSMNHFVEQPFDLGFL